MHLIRQGCSNAASDNAFDLDGTSQTARRRRAGRPINHCDSTCMLTLIELNYWERANFPAVVNVFLFSGTSFDPGNRTATAAWQSVDWQSTPTPGPLRQLHHCSCCLPAVVAVSTASLTHSVRA
jgi:hypothetical protein